MEEINKYYEVRFMKVSKEVDLVKVGDVLIEMKGEEEIYEDIGNLGRKNIVREWMWIVLKWMIINYLGKEDLII